MEASTAPQRFQFLLMAGFAILSMLMAAAGVYGVMSYLVARRTREIGIRIAVGAQPADMLAMVLGESGWLTAVAVMFGLAGAWALTRYLANILFGVSAVDLPTFAAAPLVLAATVMAASWGPARRASRVDVIAALRED